MSGVGPTKKFNLGTLTAMVVGSMIGAGIFSLPQIFGRATGPIGALISWLIAGFGMLMLAFVFQSLSRRKPELDVGVYTYAKAGFGNYLGFSSAFGYWAGTCLGNVTYFILFKATLSSVVPSFGNGDTIQAVFVSSVILWLVHFTILRGVREAAIVNTIATVTKIIPIFLFIIFVAFGFKADIFAVNFWGGPDEVFNWRDTFQQVRASMLATVFVFLGIEGASVYSRYAKKRNDVGVATVLGFLGVLCLLIMVTMLSYGVMLRPELAALRNPSMGGVLEAVVGRWGSLFINITMMISVVSAFLSWSLLAAEVLFAAAKSNTMPRFFARENRNKVPTTALLFSSIMVQFFLVLTLFAEKAFDVAKDLTSSMNLIPYLLVAAFGLKVALKGDAYHGEPRQRWGDVACAGIATVYAAGLIYAGGLKYLLLSAALYGPGTILFYVVRREQGKRLFTPLEWIFFLIMAIGAIVAIYAVIIGRIAV